MRDTGYVLKVLRQRQGLTQMDVAGRLFVSNSEISLVEQGKRRLSLDQLGEYCDAYGVNVFEFVNYIFERPGAKFPRVQSERAVSLFDVLSNLYLHLAA